MHKTHLTVWVSAELKEAAKKAGVNMSNLVEMALKEAIGFYATEKIDIEELTEKLKQKETEAAALRARLKQQLEAARKEESKVKQHTVWSSENGAKSN